MRLSDRHLEIVTLVGRDGLTYRKVAERLGIHPSTVEVHVARIVKRAGLDMRPREVLHRVYHVHVLSGKRPD